jgi:hypothetical protein
LTDRRTRLAKIPLASIVRSAFRTVLAGSLLLLAGCGEENVEPHETASDKATLDKLDSEDPDKFLEGVDEARDKYGKPGEPQSANP